MANNFSMLEIMSAAAVSVGLDPITSQNDGTPEFVAMSRNWPLIVQAELEAGRYSFTRREAQLLSRIPGKFGQPDGYLIPGDALAVRHVWTEDENGLREFSPDWLSDGQAIYLDAASGCKVEYLSAPDPSLWSANFALGVQAKLEAVIYRMESDETAARDADVRAEAAFQTARTVSSKDRAARPMQRGMGGIAASRFSRGAR